MTGRFTFNGSSFTCATLFILALLSEPISECLVITPRKLTPMWFMIPIIPLIAPML